MKQIGLALHNYHDVFGSFPIGTRGSTPGGWGLSWWSGTLPYMDQAPLYNQLEFGGANSGWTNNDSGRINGAAANGKSIAVMVCPSSPVPALKDTGGGFFTNVPHYVGITGAADGDGFTNNAVHPQWVCCGCCPSATLAGNSGFHARGGVLIPMQSIRFRDITDGASNTIVVGESGNWGKDTNGNNHQINHNHGFFMGQSGLSKTPGSRSFNITTIRWPPNTNDISSTAGAGPRGAGRGNNDGVNNGIYAAHPGGVHCLVGDGRVEFISENINMRTLKLLATRDDNQVVGEF